MKSCSFIPRGETSQTETSSERVWGPSWDTDAQKILWSVSMNMTAPGASRSHSGSAPIDLVPLETDECK